MSASYDSPEANAVTAIFAEAQGHAATKGDRMSAVGFINKLGDRGFAIGPARLGFNAVKTAAQALSADEQRLLAEQLQRSAGAQVLTHSRFQPRPRPPQPPSAA